MTLAVDEARARECRSSELNALLPTRYLDALEQESAEGLQLALGGLRAAVAQGDLSRGATFHCGALRRYLTLKHQLPDEARVEAIELLYRLVRHLIGYLPAPAQDSSIVA